MATVTKEPATTTAAAAALPEDESLKRNTDCVYFLASPLTCKKGSECEYRHSEYARINPRDCWYWMNGNCLNPKCPFRHPPLEGLMGPQAGNFAGPSVPAPPAPPALPVASAPPSAPKKGVPCIFFQQGYCLKGDRCPFSHGPNPPNSKIPQNPATTPATEAPTFKKAFGGLEKCTQAKMNFQANTSKVVEAPLQVNAISKVETSLPRDGVHAGRRVPPPSGLIEEPPKYKEPSALPSDNGFSRSRTGRAHHASLVDDQSYQNGRDVDDSLRESSPGFDVLVDDKLREDEFYHNEDQYGRMRGHDGRSLNDFEMGRRDDYNSVADVEPEIYRSRRGYDSYDRYQERHGKEQRRVSSERSVVEPAHYDRRGPYKSRSPDIIQNSDLRHRLSKHRRVNGLKSVVNPDYNRDKHAEDRGYRGGTRRDSRRSPTRESSISSRLQGRIKLPRKPSPVSGGNMYSERENERGRSRGRSSPSRPPQVSSHQGRLRDRLSGRIVQDESNEGRIRGPVMRRDSMRENETTFAGPKSLAELRGTKQADNKQQQQLKGQPSISGGKLRDAVLESSLGTEGNLSFEGPKPLSEILKRKRGGGANSENKEESKQNENNEENSAADHTTEKQAHLSSASTQPQTEEQENKSVNAEGDEEGEISNKKLKLNDGESSFVSNEKNHPEEEEGFVPPEGEEHELDEEYDQGDGEYEYEQEDGEGYNLNEGEETVEHEEDFMDEDDGDDDFAKKIGVSF